MKRHRNNHVKSLEKIKMDFAVGNVPISSQNNLASQVKKIWVSVAKKFHQGIIPLTENSLLE